MEVSGSVEHIYTLVKIQRHVIRLSIRTVFCGARRVIDFPQSGVEVSRAARGAGVGELSWAPPPPVNINTGSGSRLRIDIRRGEITTLNIYEPLVSEIKIGLF